MLSVFGSRQTRSPVVLNNGLNRRTVRDWNKFGIW